LAQLQKRWLDLPAFQRSALGKTDRERLLAFVNTLVVPDMLYSLALADDHAPRSERSVAIEKSVLRLVLMQRVRADADAKHPITDADIREYFEAHRSEFDRPDRLRIFRILLDTEPDARAVIDKARGATSLDVWNQLAREKSVDRATAMRGGDLGFAAADGTTEVPELRVDPALPAAAQQLKDGEISGNPVPEGHRFAVLWRRGHVAAVRSTPDAEAAHIPSHLREQRAAAALDELVARLRATYVREVNPKVLDTVEFAQ
jgi:peptidyl-prolyl cis-trans isomerase C